MTGVRTEIRSLLENPDGSLWAGTSNTGLVRVRPVSPPSSGLARPEFTVEQFGTEHGLSRGGVWPARIDGQLLFRPWGSSTEIYVASFDEASGRFVREPTLSALPSDRLLPAFGLIQGADGRIFANFGRGTAILTRAADGTWSADMGPFSRFGRGPSGIVVTDPNGVAWFGWKQTFVRFDIARSASTATPFSALVRRVTAGQDQALYSGAGSPADGPLPASTSALRVEFSAPTFFDDEATEYQTRLDGLDDDWSGWSRDSRRDFTNLGFGDYRFHVRARNITGQVSSDATYAFTILPPWYRTWWAYAGYVALLGLTLFGADRFQRRRLVGKERERAQLAEAKLRAEAAEVAGPDRERGQEEHRAAQRHRPRDHRLARLRDHLRQALRAGQPVGGRRRVRRRPVPPRAQADRIPAGHRGGQALRALHPRHDRPRPAAGVVHRASQAGGHQRHPDRVLASTSAGSRRRASAWKTGRCPRRRSRSSTCRSKPRTACSGSSPSRASRKTPTPTTTSTCCRAWRRIQPSPSTMLPPIAS